MSGVVNTDPSVIGESGFWNEAQYAVNFVRGVHCGANEWTDISRYETVYGESDGFVYFIGIGDPYTTHVKIGYTKKDPETRLASLQTGCPFKMRLLGYIFGNVCRERELHDVLKNYRCEGEWFAYDDYPATIINDQLGREYR